MITRERRKPKLTHGRLLEILSYNPATGVFRWRVKAARRIRVGDIAGNQNNNGYRFISIGNRLYAEHRLAWFYVYGQWPPGDLDHQSTVRCHNWISNLRPATRSQNVANSRLRVNSTSGFKGVSPNNKGWMARIRSGRAILYLGTFTTPEEAHTAYVAKATELFGEFANDGL